MGDEVKHGITAALATMELGVPPSDDAGDQVDMFEADEPSAPMLVSSRAAPGPKGGRPKGARNKKTAEWVDYLLSKYRSPLVGLLELAARTPEDLARELGLYMYHEGKLVMTAMLDANGVQLRDAEGDLRWQPVLATGEAFKAQVAAMMAALPYIHQRQPMAVEVTQPARGVLVIGDLRVEGSAQGLQLPLPPTEQNQGVIDAEIVQSHDQKSHGAKE